MVKPAAEAPSETPKTLVAAIEATVNAYPEHTAMQIWEYGRRRAYTYKEMREAARMGSSKLQKCGIRPGDRVVLVADSRTIEWVLAFLSILYAEATPAIIDSSLTPEDIQQLLHRVDARAVITSGEIYRKQPDRIQIPVLDIDNELGPVTSFPAKKLSKTADPDPSLACILFTSGTTAEPKGVMLTEEGLVYIVEKSIEAGRLVHEDQQICVLPLHHVFGLVGVLLTTLFQGATLTFVEKLQGDVIITAMQRSHTTIILAIPRVIESFYRGILDAVHAKGKVAEWMFYLLSRFSGFLHSIGIKGAGRFFFKKVHEKFGGNIQRIVSGAAPIAVDILKQFERMGIPVMEGYGLTETSATATVNSFSKRRLGTVGQATPGTAVTVINPDATGEGEVCIKGPGVMKGYFRDSEGTNEVMQQGWFHSGDLGRIDRKGYLTITGRIKELIVRDNGKKAQPNDVESRYQEIPGIKELAVFGFPSSKGPGEEVHAAVIVTEELKKEKLSNEQLQQRIEQEVIKRSKQVPPHFRINKVHLINSLPKTTTLKVKRGELCHMVANKQAHLSFPKLKKKKANKEEWDALTHEVIEIVKNVTHYANLGDNFEITPATSFQIDLSFDSLNAMELVFAVETQFKVTLNKDQLDKIDTIEDLLITLREAQTKKKEGKSASTAERNFRQKLFVEDEIPHIQVGKFFERNTLLDRTFTPMLHWMTKKLYRGYFHLNVQGEEHLPKEGSYILCSNHSSHLDILALLVASGKDYHDFGVLSAEDYFFNGESKNSVLKSLLNLVPFSRSTNIKKIIQNFQVAKKCTELDKNLVIFPEGTRSLNGDVNPFKSFIGILGLELNVPIIPARIEGAHACMPKGARFPKSGEIRVTFGSPLELGKYHSDVGQVSDFQLYDSIAKDLHQRVVDLSR